MGKKLIDKAFQQPKRIMGEKVKPRAMGNNRLEIYNQGAKEHAPSLRALVTALPLNPQSIVIMYLPFFPFPKRFKLF